MKWYLLQAWTLHECRVSLEEAFLAANGCLPWASADDAEERKLATWCAKVVGHQEAKKTL
eukprot:5131946-Amphidinium_carterae.1